MTKREKAIRRRRKFVISVVLVVLIIAGIIVGVVSCADKKNNSSSDNASSNIADVGSKEATSNSEDTDEDTVSSEPEEIADTNGLDAEYENLLLVNGDNPLPQTYDSDVREYLVDIDENLRNNNYVTKIHGSVYPYITAMVKKAQEDGVDLKVWSPFRSYADQEMLFNKQVERAGGDEQKAATVVARPGTSEHNTGICADFNMADDAFENTPMYEWMCENAEDYGFILRYPKNKQDKTGVIYESWHWRFVGINTAKKINKSGLCLEEYLEKNNIKQTVTVDF